MNKVTFGQVITFNHECQDWSLFKGRLDQWFLANDINSESDKSGGKRRAILLSSLTESTYRLIRDLALPSDVGTLSFVEVTALFDGHFKGKKCGFAERWHFHSASQRTDESLSSWAARVRGLAMDCGFPAGNLDETLRDRFVLGMAGTTERDRLFREPMEGLTLSKALQLAESIRCAVEGARQARPVVALEQASNSFDVHKMAARAAPFRAASHAARNSASESFQQRSKSVTCDVCGYSGHSAEKCRFKNYVCKSCGKKGHLRRVCSQSGNHFLQCCSDEDDGKRLVFNIRSYRGEPMMESVLVDQVTLSFEVDSGAEITAISDRIYEKYFIGHRLNKAAKVLQSYDGTQLQTLGVISLPFTYNSYTKIVDVYVVKNGGPPLLGRDFIAKFNLQLCPVNYASSIDNFIKQYPKLFSDNLGCCKGITVELKFKENSTPKFFKARPVPFALRSKIEEEIKRLEKLGIIEPVASSEFASPIVPVLRQDGKIRLCADYSATLNTQLEIEKYPLPRIDELFSKLYGGQEFTKLDLSGAYNQLVLSKSSQLATCINTHKGLYKFTRLVFGLSSAPSIFQRTLEKILSGIDGVLQFIDDILITGKDRREHMSRLEEVFRRLENAGLVLKKEKCHFFQKEVSYLGFIIDKNGLHKSPEKVKAIVEAKRPENVSELKSFLGLVNYYRLFLKNASTIMCPMHSLLQKNVKWQWDKQHEDAFVTIKNALVADNTLAHYNMDAKIILTVDASPGGLGAVLSQVEADGVERPVAYMSRSLSKAERQYSQIQKEATAIIFGVRKFHQYLYGRSEPFLLRTDHKPLLSIFRPGKGVPEVSANRLQRYALFLSAYNYTIEFVSSTNNCADFLSRSLHNNDNKEKCDNETLAASGGEQVALNDSDFTTYVNFLYEADSIPMSVKDLSTATKSDKILSKIGKFISEGWKNKNTEKELHPYFSCKTELSIEKGCVMRGDRIVAPVILQKEILKELHKGHLGVVKMKADARNRFWWPGMSSQIEETVTSCSVCTQLRPAPPRAPLTTWPHPPEPWHRVHLDFLGPLNSKMYLVAVDAYSKWVEVYDVSTGYGSKIVIDKLCDLMSRFGLIKNICTDNGPSFISEEFENFCLRNGIEHFTSPSYNPASNGQAESYVKIVKRAIKAILLSGCKNSEIQSKLCEFLFYYRNSKHSTTERSPAQVLFGRNLRNRLDLLNPLQSSSDTTLANTVHVNQCLQAKYYGGKRNIHFKVTDIVLVKAFKNKKSFWTKGEVIKKIGRSAYLVKLLDSSGTLKRHTNQMYLYKGEKKSLETTEPSEGQSSQQQQCQLDYWEDITLLPTVNLITPSPEVPPSTDAEEWVDCHDSENFERADTIQGGEEAVAAPSTATTTDCVASSCAEETTGEASDTPAASNNDNTGAVETVSNSAEDEEVASTAAAVPSVEVTGPEAQSSTSAAADKTLRRPRRDINYKKYF